MATARALRFAAIGALAGLAALAVFRLVGPAADLEAALEDRVRIALGAPVAAQHPGVSLIAIDEATMATLPYRSPVDRGLLADIVGMVGAAGARAIGLDILLDQATEPAKDARLAAALAAFPGNAVIAWADARAGMTGAQSAWLADFAAAAGAKTGFANLYQDPDGVVRRHAATLPNAETPSFAAALTGAAGPAGAGPVWRVDWLQAAPGGAPAFQKTPAHVIPLMAQNPQILETWYKDRIVIVGADLPQQDRHATPLSSVLGEAPTAGPEIHAQLAAQILDGRRAAEFGPWRGAAWVMAAGLLAAALAVTPVALILRLALLGALGAGVLGATLLSFSAGGAVPPIAPALLALILGAGGAMGLDAVLAHRGRRFVRRAFAHYLAPELVDRLVRDPGALRLGGERRRMTFLFTDIAGFTGMSERLEAEALAQLLNAYLDGVSAIVMRHGGVIDKYIGDAVVALFGAPHEEPQHAAKAIACATEIDAFAENFRREHAAAGLGVTRIGIHTGEAVVGNFGGAARFDYTAIGDAMNTAARLEGANKAFGTRVCFSGACHDAAGPDLAPGLRIAPVGDVLLKGKTGPLPVFALRPDRDAGWVDRYRAAYARLASDPAAAKAAFAALGADPLAALHLDRLAQDEAGTIFELTEK